MNREQFKERGQRYLASRRQKDDEIMRPDARQWRIISEINRYRDENTAIADRVRNVTDVAGEMSVSNPRRGRFSRPIPIESAGENEFGVTHFGLQVDQRFSWRGNVTESNIHFVAMAGDEAVAPLGETTKRLYHDRALQSGFVEYAFAQQSEFAETLAMAETALGIPVPETVDSGSAVT